MLWLYGNNTYSAQRLIRIQRETFSTKIPHVSTERGASSYLMRPFLAFVFNLVRSQRWCSVIYSHVIFNYFDKLWHLHTFSKHKLLIRSFDLWKDQIITFHLSTESCNKMYYSIKIMFTVTELTDICTATSSKICQIKGIIWILGRVFHEPPHSLIKYVRVPLCSGLWKNFWLIFKSGLLFDCRVKFIYFLGCVCCPFCVMTYWFCLL